MNHRGFTLIELLVAVFVIVLATTGITVALSHYTRTQALHGATRLVISEIEDARGRTLSSKGSSEYGVFFDDDRVVLFRGGNYSAGDPANEVTILDTRTTILSVSLSGGGSEIVFERLSGEASEDGTVEVALVNDPSIKQTITIQGTGLVSYE